MTCIEEAFLLPEEFAQLELCRRFKAMAEERPGSVWTEEEIPSPQFALQMQQAIDEITSHARARYVSGFN